MSDAAHKANKAVQPAVKTGMGKLFNSGHPIHPATVHYPIGLLSISFGLDALQLAPWLTSGLTWLKVMPPAAAVNVLSHYTGAAGLIAALPTLASGIAELYGMWQGQAESKGSVQDAGKDAIAKKDVAGEKLKVTLTHATLNDIVLGIAAYNWWIRRQSKDLILPPFNATLSALAIPIFLYSAYLGGSLVYKYGVGVMRQGEAAEIKKRQEKEQ
ncbi:hypothetical protein JCM10908_000926 [Rhodotorula pacifica]|uniref:DUF2231 domain-containing protein n=1 Tax=Rhodotorula pacifica TaxID=1495444 RepID=UPI00316B94C5